MRRFAFVASLCAAVLLAAPAAPKGIELDSREYKLMLRPEKFGADPAKKVGEFWDKTLGPLIRDSGLKTKNGLSRHRERSIEFLETGDCLLNRHGYALRIRAKTNAGSKDEREVTLKLRAPDALFVSLIKLKASDKKAKSKFEEDVTALAPSSKPPPELDLPRRSRSLFSRSVTVKIDGPPHLKKLGDLLDLYPNFDKRLDQFAKVDWSAGLNPGKDVSEHVFDEAVVELAPGAEAEITLTIWNVGTEQVAEVSFKYDLDPDSDGPQEAMVTFRAARLFDAMQKGLSAWIDQESETKTSFGLPDQCSGS
jgi:hypothetical protein